MTTEDKIVTAFGEQIALGADVSTAATRTADRFVEAAAAAGWDMPAKAVKAVVFATIAQAAVAALIRATA